MTELMRWRMIGYMLALFVAGAITGAAVMARTAAGSNTLKVGRTDEIAALIWQKWSALELTGEQKEKLDPLIRSTSQELEKSHLKCLDDCSTAVDKLYSQAQAVDLTPGQQEKLKQLDAERHASMKKKYNYPPEVPPAGNH